MNLRNGLHVAYQNSSTVQWLGRPTSVREVMGSNLGGDSDFFFVSLFFFFFFFHLARDKWTFHPGHNYSRCSVGYAREISSNCWIDRPMDLNESEIMQYSNSDMLTLGLTPPVGEGFVWPSGTEKRMHGLSQPVYRLKMSRKASAIIILLSLTKKMWSITITRASWSFTLFSLPVSLTHWFCMEKFNFDHIPGRLVGLVTNEVSSPLELNDVSFLNWSYSRIS